MITYGLIGFPLTHSLSEKYFSEKFRKETISGKEYRLFPLISLEQLSILVGQNTGIEGLNITIPYKEKIIPYLDAIEDTARKTGAVNTIKIYRKNGRTTLKGFNTDAEAFRVSADFSGHSKALILGTGGGAKAVKYALDQLGIQSLFVSRNPGYPGTIGYSDLNKKSISEHTLIINSTPLGMYPEIQGFPPIPYHFLTRNHFLYDLVYNPGLTMFLKKGEEMGTTIQNGLKMLHLQAEKSYMIWNDVTL